MGTRASKSRYEIVEQTGAGDFATVYAAQDKKLGREVAIKQLHQQFLADKDTLARYWQEAQLLVSLEHPNVTTIFDVVRSRGCLVLELMQGSLQRIYDGQPAPVEDVRQAILHAANGLHCLHENGIIHGDIKPGNLLLSRHNVVKLGDFGLARRANDPDGSLLKGTTKYMAPELVASQFGDVGPASDLYSLGFTALALLCGDKFDSLFPELQVYGRDQQMAWMLWHCAADRKVPKLAAILAGVPEDLAQVIEKLTCKDQSQRYRSAVEVIADLNGKATPVAMGSAADTEALQLQHQKNDDDAVRTLLDPQQWTFRELLAFCPESHRGHITSVQADEGHFVLAISTGEETGAELVINVPPRTTILLNGQTLFQKQQVRLATLRSGDEVAVEHSANETEIVAHAIEASRVVQMTGSKRLRQRSPRFQSRAKSTFTSQLALRQFSTRMCISPQLIRQNSRGRIGR